MAAKYVIDACALIAAMTEEDGADVVADIFERAIATPNEVITAIHRINILEVYYDVYKRFGKEAADSFLTEMHDNPIEIVSDLSDDFLKEAGKLKAEHPISLADAIALALTKKMDAKLLTCDHHEFDAIDDKGEIGFEWVR